ncbi:PIN domain-containing protein [Agrococcus sp. KRD186]|uniref:PIN domain-containing protein n=1 Tax=Agrococcus sp. KRD186 TaxID=2729730 RepID=UPI0019D033CB
MKILDAGAVVELLIGAVDPLQLGDEDLAAPHLLDSEVTHALRGLVLRGGLTEEEGAAAMADFGRLDLTRYPAEGLRDRMWALRRNLSAYDATYVALAELTEATALLTTDARLASAPGPTCRIELLR